jgi:hypothetical protein
LRSPASAERLAKGQQVSTEAAGEAGAGDRKGRPYERGDYVYFVVLVVRGVTTASTLAGAGSV